METKVNYLKTLDDVLRQSYKPWEYSLNGYSEDVLCMEESKNSWIIYRGSRGRKTDVRSFDNLLHACLVYLNEISSSKSNTASMREQFLSLAVDNVKENVS